MLESLKLLTSGTIVLIALVTYIIVWAIKQTQFSNKYLPIVAIIIGAVIGIFIALTMADTSWIMGLITGVVSGAVSVGGNELVKSILAAFSNDGGDQGAPNQK